MRDVTLDVRPLHGFFARENIILISSLFVLMLSYLASVSNSYLPDKWSINCCGKMFWWSAVGSSVILLGSAGALLVKRVSVYLLALPASAYVFYYSFHIALQKWSEYSSVDRAYGLQQALLPIYRPLSLILSVCVFIVAIRELARRSLKREIQ